MSRTICVVGAGGVVGSAICRAMLGAGWAVAAVTRTRPASVAGVAAHVVAALDKQVQLLEELSPEVVVDLRAFAPANLQGFVETATRRRITWFNVSSIYAQLRLGGLAAAGCRGPVVLSPSSPSRPSGPYGEGKLACERIWSASDAAAALLRLPFVVGQGDRSGRVEHYAKRLFHSSRIRLPDAGSRLVPLIAADDVAAWVRAAASRDDVRGTIQISVDSRTLRDHVLALGAGLGVPAEVTAGPAEVTPPFFSYPVDLVADEESARRWVPDWRPAPWEPTWRSIATGLDVSR